MRCIYDDYNQDYQFIHSNFQDGRVVQNIINRVQRSEVCGERLLMEDPISIKTVQILYHLERELHIVPSRSESTIDPEFCTGYK